MSCLTIETVIGREIMDSRGNPTVEAEVVLAGGAIGRGAAPSGASTGEFEALELRDGDANRYLGKGVTKAVANINGPIRDALAGMDASDIYAVDAAMIQADGTKDKSCARGFDCAGHSAVPVPWRHLRQSPAGADDEHSQWRCTRGQYRGRAGIYDFTCWSDNI